MSMHDDLLDNVFCMHVEMFDVVLLAYLNKTGFENALLLYNKSKHREWFIIDKLAQRMVYHKQS